MRCNHRKSGTSGISISAKPRIGMWSHAGCKVDRRQSNMHVNFSTDIRCARLLGQLAKRPGHRSSSRQVRADATG